MGDFSSLDTTNMTDDEFHRMYRDDMSCVMISCAFSFHKKIAHLYFADNHCCDMTAAIKFARSVMPDVVQIQTFNASGPDTVYDNSIGEWKAY